MAEEPLLLPLSLVVQTKRKIPVAIRAKFSPVYQCSRIKSLLKSYLVISNLLNCLRVDIFHSTNHFVTIR